MDSVPPEVRLLPMSSSDPEFKAYTAKELQDRYFLQKLPHKKGRYLYASRALRAQEGSLVLFQWEGRLVASALFQQLVEYETPKKESYDGKTGTYKGHLQFDYRSIKVFDPVDHAQVKHYWPSFKKFSQPMQYLRPPDRFQEFERNEIKNVRRPHFWLGADEAEDSILGDTDSYSPDERDRRPIIERQIRERRGQSRFRNDLRSRYGDQCLVTRCSALAVVEAAHISPYRGEEDNHVENGLLLRSDIHTLFDLDLLGINPEDLRVELHPNIKSEYSQFAGIKLSYENRPGPSQEALKLRYDRFRQRLGMSN